MGLKRFAGDALRSTGGKKTNATIGAIDSGFDTVGTLRAIGSQLHPALGFMDDAASVAEGVKGIGNNISDNILNGVNTLGSLGGVISTKAPALGAQLGQAGPLGIALGTGATIGKWMQDNLDQNVSSSGRGTGRQSFKKDKK